MMFNIISIIIGHINQKIAAFGISAGVAVAFTNVVARYAFDASLVWATELTIFLFLWSVFFGAAYCFKKNAHIAVTVIVDIVPSKIAKIMLVTSSFISFIFLITISYYGYQYTLLIQELEEKSIDLWDLPMEYVYAVIPISFAFGAYRVAERIIVLIRTPHDKIVEENEGQVVLTEAGITSKDAIKLNEIVKEAEKKTGGML
ncbi:MAG: TRAP transporter small permease [Campylobacteraceae bacterium]|nr:TRAP transporter small permease [Campylobacteraceae bacterium]